MRRAIAIAARGNYRQRACYIENAIGVAIVDKATLLCARVVVILIAFIMSQITQTRIVPI